MPAPTPIIASAEGYHLAGSPLWFDALGRKELCFVSHWRRWGRGGHERVVATADTLALATARRKNCLIAEFGRRFAIGNLNLELHPSGRMLGAAAARVDFGRLSLVYVSEPSATPPFGWPGMSALPAPVWVIDQPLPPGDSAAPIDQAAALVVQKAREWQAQGRSLQVFCEAGGHDYAIMLALAAENLPVSGSAMIDRSRRCGLRHGLALPELKRRLGDTIWGVQVLSLEEFAPAAGARHAGDETLRLVVTPGSAPGQFPGAGEIIAVRHCANPRELHEILSNAGVEYCYVAGRGARAWAEALSKHGMSVQALLAPEQPRLV